MVTAKLMGLSPEFDEGRFEPVRNHDVALGRGGAGAAAVVALFDILGRREGRLGNRAADSFEDHGVGALFAGALFDGLLCLLEVAEGLGRGYDAPHRFVASGHVVPTEKEFGIVGDRIGLADVGGLYGAGTHRAGGTQGACEDRNTFHRIGYRGDYRSRNRSQSSAAMQPDPAAVIACR